MSNAEFVTPQKSNKITRSVSAIAETRLPTTQLAFLTGYSPTQINSITRAAGVDRSPQGFKVGEAIRGIIRYLQGEREDKRAESTSKAREARTELYEVQILERTNELQKAARDEAISVAEELIGSFRADIMAIPARVTNDLALRAKIESEIETTLDAASRRFERARAGNLDSDAASTEETENDD
jgi:hypothetical protein